MADQLGGTLQLAENRQRLTTGDKKVLDDDSKSLSELGVADGETLEIKDLGPQICMS